MKRLMKRTTSAVLAGSMALALSGAALADNININEQSTGFGGSTNLDTITGYPTNFDISALPWLVDFDANTEQFSIVATEAVLNFGTQENYSIGGNLFAGGPDSTVFFTYNMTIGNATAGCSVGASGLPTPNDCSYDVTGGKWSMFFDADGIDNAAISKIRLAQMSITGDQNTAGSSAGNAVNADLNITAELDSLGGDFILQNTFFTPTGTDLFDKEFFAQITLSRPQFIDIEGFMNCTQPACGNKLVLNGGSNVDRASVNQTIEFRHLAPEPGTVALLGLGLVGLGVGARRRRKA